MPGNTATLRISYFGSGKDLSILSFRSNGNKFFYMVTVEIPGQLSMFLKFDYWKEFIWPVLSSASLKFPILSFPC